MGFLTLALHAFHMLDQDLFFTYARDLDPWFRRPLGIAQHATIGLAMLALVVLLARLRQGGENWLFLAVLPGFIACHTALHAVTSIEMRFGLPLLVLAGPMAWWAASEIARLPGWRFRAVVFLAVISWATGSLALSEWVRA